MPDERESPSAGWREVCDEMATDAGAEEATHPCPDCGSQCENVLRDVYECEEHDVFRASASDGETKPSNSGKETRGDPSDADDTPDESDETGRRAKSSAD